MAEITSEELEVINEFKLYVNDLFDSGLNYTFANGGDEHARVVLSKILSESKFEVRTVCGSLAGDDTFFDDTYTGALKIFLSRGGRYTVILNNYDANRGIKESVKNLETTYKDQIKVYTTEKKIALDDKGIGSEDIHITVGDGKHCRMEYDTVYRKAVCVFNDDVNGKRLEGIFDSVMDGAKQIFPEVTNNVAR